MDKLKGTSTVEAVMSMVLSGIVLTAISAAFLYVIKSYGLFQEANAAVNEMVLFNSSMSNDFINYQKIVSNDNSLEFYSKNREKTQYRFSPEFIIKTSGSRQDTFRISCNENLFYREGNLLTSREGLTDAVKLTIGTEEEQQTFFFSKLYPNDILMEEEEINITTVADGI